MLSVTVCCSLPMHSNSISELHNNLLFAALVVLHAWLLVFKNSTVPTCYKSM